MTAITSETTPLRIMQAGVGSFSQRVLIPGFLACPDARLLAVFGPTREKTEAIARTQGIPHVYTDYQQMLDEVEADAVVIATPNDMHYPMVQAALRRGLHVFCEKSLALTAADARDLEAAATAAGVRTAVNFTYRSTNAFRFIARLLEEDAAGRIFHFHVALQQNIRADPAVPLGYRMLKERGGGALMDIGVHLFDTVRWWFGDIASVCGLAETVIPERPAGDGRLGAVTADDTATALVRLASGASGTVQVSQVASGRGSYRRIEIFGSDGGLVVEEDRTLGPEVRVARRGEGTMAVVPMPPDLDVPFQDFPRFHASRIVAALRGETPDWPDFHDGARAQEAVDAVLRSVTSGQWEAVA